MLTPRIFRDAESLGDAARRIVEGQLLADPRSLICAASGGTPTKTYHLLAESAQRDPQLFAAVRLLKLDEWGGMDAAHCGSCERHLQETLVEPLGAAARYVGFQGTSADPEGECRRIAAWLASHGPIDLCVLGLGMNGHLGFNEPAEELAPHAHVAILSADSQQHAMVRDLPDAPVYGLTLGMADLLHARRIVLLVSGAAKRQPLQRLLSGAVTTDFPASLLQLHPQVDLLCDLAAAGEG